MALLQSEGALFAISGAGRGGAPVWSTMPRLDGKRRALDVDFLDYAAIFRTQPNIRTVVSFRSRNIAHVGLHAYHRTSDTERERLDFKSDLSRLIRKPNPYVTRYRFWEAADVDLGIFGNTFALKVPDPDTGRLGLYRIPPQFVSLAPSPWLWATGYVIKVGNNELKVPASQMLHMLEHNPDDPRWGLSPLEAALQFINEDIESSKYRREFWRNAARIDGILEHKGKLTDTARSRLRADWKNLHAGAENSGSTAILEEGMKFTPASFSAKEAQYLEARKLTREEAASLYHINPAMIGILDNTNFSNMTAQHTFLYQDTLGPRFAFYEDEFELQVVPDVAGGDEDIYVEFNIAEKLKGSFEEQADALQSMVGAPLMLRNEGRARLNLKPVPGGDELVTPLNVLVGGQASPQDADSTIPKAKVALLQEFVNWLYADGEAGLPELVGSRNGKEGM